MNKLTKIALGWVLWTVGTILFAHLTTNAAYPLVGEATAVEFAYGAFMVSYLIGIPVLTTAWVFEK